MNTRWIQIIIGGLNTLPPIMIFDGKEVCKAKLMRTLSALVEISADTSKVPIDFVYTQRNEEGEKEVYRDTVYLLKEGGLINKLSSILGGRTKRTISIDIFFNENEAGICVGFLASNFQPLKYIVKDTKNVSAQEEKQVFDSSTAKELFVNNYTKFAKILPLSVLRSANDMDSKWEEAINSINGSGALLSEFQKYKGDSDAWVKLLYSWGLKKDTCTKYVGLIVNQSYYMTEDMASIDENSEYQVISPCWTIWLDENGRSVEKLVSKGFLRKI